MNEFLRKERVSSKYRSKLGMASSVPSDDFDRVDDMAEFQSRLPALEAALGVPQPRRRSGHFAEGGGD